MSLPLPRPGRRHHRARAFTMVELMVAVALGSLVLTAVGMLSLYGARSYCALVNYADLDGKSRYALDVIAREIRQATALVSFQTNLPVKSLTLFNADQAATITLTYDSNAGTMVLAKTGQPSLTALTGCDRWDFALYRRDPLISSTNITFYTATNSTGQLDPSLCKLINMTWKCSRTILAQKVNTESVQTAQIVLRNKQ